MRTTAISFWIGLGLIFLSTGVAQAKSQRPSSLLKLKQLPQSPLLNDQCKALARKAASTGDAKRDANTVQRLLADPNFAIGCSPVTYTDLGAPEQGVAHFKVNPEQEGSVFKTGTNPGISGSSKGSSGSQKGVSDR